MKVMAVIAASAGNSRQFGQALQNWRMPKKPKDGLFADYLSAAIKKPGGKCNG